MPNEKRHRVPPRMTARARRLRREATYPERKLWSRLRGGQLEGVRFRRQHVIGPYVADFYCADALLIIELDRHSHDTTADTDLKREEYLERQGYRILRFGNDDVIREIEGVLEAICSAVEHHRERETLPPPRPSP